MTFRFLKVSERAEDPQEENGRDAVVRLDLQGADAIGNLRRSRSSILRCGGPSVSKSRT
jgi:hypothetical protein